MKKDALILFQVCLICFLYLPLLAQAETRYVTDRFEILLRSGPSGSHAIQRMVYSGTSLEVLEHDSEKGYTKVQTKGGTEGWVLSRYLMKEPAARTQLEKLTKQLTNTTAEGGSMRTQLNSIKNEYDDARKRIVDLDGENKRLEDELAKIKRTAADVLAIDMQNKELSQQLTETETRVNALQQENNALTSGKERDWFIAGALVLFVGLLLGLILPRISWQKRSRYGGF